MKKLFILALSIVAAWGAAHAEYAVKFLPPATQEQARIATHMRQSGTLENFTTLINRAIVTPREVPVIARACGVLGWAGWACWPYYQKVKNFRKSQSCGSLFIWTPKINA